MKEKSVTFLPPSEPSDPAGQAGFRRAALREFLRARRSKLVPESLGLPERRRRHAPGLRLQEVAELADVSTGWYASFELGYATNITPRTLSAIAKALDLNEAETAYVFQLVGTPLPQRRAVEAAPVSPALRHLVEDYRDGIALLVDFRYDILAANGAAYQLGLAGADDGFERNLFWRCFTVPECLRLSRSWRDPQALHLVATLRRLYAESAGDGRLEELIRALAAASTEFARLWEMQAVAASSSRHLHFLLPNDEAIVVETVILAAEAGLRICYFVPVGAADRRLLRAYR